MERRFEPDESLAVPRGSTNIEDLVSNNKQRRIIIAVSNERELHKYSLEVRVVPGISQMMFSFYFELDAFLESNFSSSSASNNREVQSVSNLLQQVLYLYGRRGFPCYAFCVVAGMDHHHDCDLKEVPFKFTMLLDLMKELMWDVQLYWSRVESCCN